MMGDGRESAASGGLIGKGDHTLVSRALRLAAAVLVAGAPAASVGPRGRTRPNGGRGPLPGRAQTYRRVVGHGEGPPHGRQAGSVVEHAADCNDHGDPVLRRQHGHRALNEIAPQTRSDRGRGHPARWCCWTAAASPAWTRSNIPTEAILRVDILPEEVALKYGYTADQRVVNIVLKPHFARSPARSSAARPRGRRRQRPGRGRPFQVATTSGEHRHQVPAAGGLTDAQRDLVGRGRRAVRLRRQSSRRPPAARSTRRSAPWPASRWRSPACRPAGTGRKLTLGGLRADRGARQRHRHRGRSQPGAGDQNLTANAVFARPIVPGHQRHRERHAGRDQQHALQGLPGVGLRSRPAIPFSPFAGRWGSTATSPARSPLRQTIDGWTAASGLTLNRDLGDWRLSLTTAYDHAETDTDDRRRPRRLRRCRRRSTAGRRPFESVRSAAGQPAAAAAAEPVTAGSSTAGNIQVLANGPLIKLPAGPLYRQRQARATSRRRSAPRSESMGSRWRDAGRATTRRASSTSTCRWPAGTNHVLGALGELSLNANTAVDDYSDFGPLPTLGFGVNWTPVPGYSADRLGNPRPPRRRPSRSSRAGRATPGVRSSTSRPARPPPSRRSAAATPACRPTIAGDQGRPDIKPLPNEDFTFTANYIDSQIDNPIETFPAASAAIEAAFPDRFIRNAAGELVEEDITPVNFASQDRRSCAGASTTRGRWASRRAGGFGGEARRWRSRARDPARLVGRAREPDGQGRWRDRSGRGGSDGGSDKPVGGRFQFALYHTFIVKDSVPRSSGRTRARSPSAARPPGRRAASIQMRSRPRSAIPTQATALAWAPTGAAPRWLMAGRPVPVANWIFPTSLPSVFGSGTIQPAAGLDRAASPAAGRISPLTLSVSEPASRRQHPRAQHGRPDALGLPILLSRSHRTRDDALPA